MSAWLLEQRGLFVPNSRVYKWKKKKKNLTKCDVLKCDTRVGMDIEKKRNHKKAQVQIYSGHIVHALIFVTRRAQLPTPAPA